MDAFAAETPSASASLPTVTAVSPAAGPPAGGTEVTITGTDLAPASRVQFGGLDAPSFACASTSCTAISPPGHGHVDITVTTAAGTSATSAGDGFTYLGPVLSRLRVLPARIVPDGVAASARGKLHRQRGTRVSYRDSSDGATSTFTVALLRPGIMRGGRCVPRSGPSLERRARRCATYQTLGTFIRRDHQGTNTFHFSGRLGRQALPAGTYRLSDVARDASGMVSRPVATAFTVVRPDKGST